MPGPIINDLLDLMPDTVIVEHALTFDGYGNALTFAAPATYSANIIGRTVIVRDSTGREQTSSRHAILAATGCKVRDRFTLPSRFDPQQPTAISVRSAVDENGPHHETVFF